MKNMNHMRSISSNASPSPFIKNGKFISMKNHVIHFLPAGYKYVIEKYGKFSYVADEGLHFFIPFVEKIAYVVDIKELNIEISPQIATTNDNVMVSLNGFLYLQFNDPIKASYGAAYPVEAAIKMSQSVMRTCVGDLTLDKLFKERSTMNTKITQELQSSALAWGCTVTRFEITNIKPIDKAVEDVLHKQSTADRERKEKIINADAEKQKVETEANAYKFKQETEAMGDAFKIRTLAEAHAFSEIKKAEAISERLKIIGISLKSPEGKLAMETELTKNYIEKYNKLAKKSTSMIIPNDNHTANSVASMIGIGSQIFSNFQHPKE